MPIRDYRAIELRMVFRMYMKDMEKCFYPYMEDLLHADGFTYRKTWYQFRRTNPIGWDIIGFPRHKHGDYIHTSVSIGVRHDAIEELITDVLAERVARDPTNASWLDLEVLKDRQKWRNNATVGADLGNIAENWFKTWEILTEPDIDRTCDEMVEMIRRHAEPYFEQFRSTEDVLEKLAPDHSESWKVGGARHHRAIKAVAAAYLLHDREVFDRLCAAKEKFLEDHNDQFGLKQFRPFTDVLRRRWDQQGSGQIADVSH